jgi:CRISPR-associated protein Csm2
MGDMRGELDKHFGHGGGQDKCKCGKPKKQEFPTCWECSQKARGGGHASSSTATIKLRDGYLEGGYFDIKNGKNYIKEAVFIKWAQDVSADLKQQGMSPNAIRNFFNKLRAVEYNYKSTKDFDRTRQDIYTFCRDVKYTENRGVTPLLFTSFIEANIAEAKKDADHFKAFIEHFQSVIAYFKDKN